LTCGHDYQGGAALATVRPFARRALAQAGELALRAHAMRAGARGA
jgi:hypothetical protein